MTEIFPVPEGFVMPERIILAADIGLDRASYTSLEGAMVSLLEDESHTLAIRLLMDYSLVSAALAEYGRGSKTTSAFAVWMSEMNSPGGRQWLLREAFNWGEGRPGRQRLALAPLILLGESQQDPAHAPRGARIIPLGSFIALAKAKGELHVSSLSGYVELENVSRVAVDQDSPELGSLLAHRCAEWLRRKVLLTHPSVLRGTQYLLAYLALVRWYAAAAALLSGRKAVGADDLSRGIAIVEAEYIYGRRLLDLRTQRPRMTLLMNSFLDLAASPADLAHNPYFRTGSTCPTGMLGRSI